jgi:hypothetical protein
MKHQSFPGDARDLVQEGDWFRDAQGRYVLFRGINLASRSKRPPYLPILPLHIRNIDPDVFRNELENVRPNLARLKSIGMNVVRLLVIWKALEPTVSPNSVSLMGPARTYLECLRQLIDELYYTNGMFVIIDFHQDLAHEIYGGDGFPDWALASDSLLRLQEPASLRDLRWGANYYHIPWLERMVCRCGHTAPMVRHTLASFWKNRLFNEEQTEYERVALEGERPRTHLERTIGQVAHFFQSLNEGAGHPAILGYEPFNEPHPVGLGKREFEKDILPVFYRNVADQVRRYDKRTFLFFEPRMDWITYNADGPEYQRLSFTLRHESFLPSILNGDREVFSFHYYDPWLLTGFPFAQKMSDTRKEWPDVFRNFRAVACARKAIPFLTEFGASQDWLKRDSDYGTVTRAAMELQFQQIEAHLLNATYWNYELYNSEREKDNWNLENFSLLGPHRTERNIDIVARPYPMRSSAKPRRIFFDVLTKNACIALDGSTVSAPTIIFVPRATHYVGGFEVRATTPESLAWNEDTQQLYWQPDRNHSHHQLVLSPPGLFNPSVLPEDCKKDLLDTRFRMLVTGGAERPMV